MKAVYFFVVRAVWRINFGWSVSKIIITIIRFRVVTSENKNIDQQGKETCIMFLCKFKIKTQQWMIRYFCLTFFNSHKKIKIKTSIIIILIYWKLRLVEPVQKKKKVAFALYMNISEATYTWKIYSKNNQHKQ